MTGHEPDLQSTEALREALQALQRHHEGLKAASVQTQKLLDALESLLTLDAEADPFPRVFASLRRVFTFSQALMLSQGREAEASRLFCTVAEPETEVGSQWPLTALLRKVLAGRAVATVPTAAALAAGAATPSWLYLPVRVREHRGILALRRGPGEVGFSRDQVELGRRFALLVSHALATRFAHQSAVRSRELHELAERLRHSEQQAQRNADLLHHIVGNLPVGLVVQNGAQQLLLSNAVAEQMLQLQPGEPLSDAVTHLLASGAAPAGRRRHRADVLEREVQLDGDTRTLLITSKSVQVFDEAMRLTLLNDISERKHYERELSQRAYYDELTGLPNRVRMQEIVAHALEGRPDEARVALAFIDLDNFKQVNDFYSHALGDALLRAVAQRVHSQIRPSDTLARISGDEFLLLIDPLPSLDALPTLIEQVVDSLKQPFHIEGLEVLTSASVGACIYPLHGRSYEALRRSADNAMYRAKQDRKGSAQYFTAAMGEALTARMAMEQRLRAALRDRRFIALFQPKVALDGGRLVGFEALVRGVQPDGTLTPPAEFIDLAVELGLLDQITVIVRDDVLQALPRLRAGFGDAVTVSLNIAARQASDVTFMDNLTRDVTPDEARGLMLELTEDALVAAERFQRRVLPLLRERGLRVSIDDFGTGYSSLAMLSDEIADEVKIDRAFICQVHQRPRSQSILRAIESLCGALGIAVVAEGVETAEELAYLRTHTHIRCAQGYWFARPMRLEDLLAQADGLVIPLTRPLSTLSFESELRANEPQSPPT